MTARNYNLDDGRSVLASLRGLIPERPLSFSEALSIAELQAAHLLDLMRVEDGPIPSEIVSELPRIRVKWRDMPTSGLSYWDGQTWIICLNRSEPSTRQRFTLFHEYKHIIDHGRTATMYSGFREASGAQQAEHAADYFAGCVLMPKRLLKRAWGDGLQQPIALGQAFDVSARAIVVRLAQLGLTDPSARCASGGRPSTPPWRGRSYFRPLSRRPYETRSA